MIKPQKLRPEPIKCKVASICGTGVLQHQHSLLIWIELLMLSLTVRAHRDATRHPTLCGISVYVVYSDHADKIEYARTLRAASTSENIRRQLMSLTPLCRSSLII